MSVVVRQVGRMDPRLRGDDAVVACRGSSRTNCVFTCRYRVIPAKAGIHAFFRFFPVHALSLNPIPSSVSPRDNSSTAAFRSAVRSLAVPPVTVRVMSSSGVMPTVEARDLM